MASSTSSGSASDGGGREKMIRHVSFDDAREIFQPAAVAPPPARGRPPKGRRSRLSSLIRQKPEPPDPPPPGASPLANASGDAEAGEASVAAAPPTSPTPARRPIFSVRRGSIESHASSHASSLASSTNSYCSSGSRGGGLWGGGGAGGGGGSGGATNSQSRYGPFSGAAYGSNTNNNANNGNVPPNRPTFSGIRIPFVSSGEDSLEVANSHSSEMASHAAAPSMPNPNASSATDPNWTPRTSRMSRVTIARRFAVGEFVLISNHDRAEGDGAANLVNRYGFPAWAGGSATSEERRGPYAYLLAQVVSVHYGEDAQYYTVRREDDGEEQRADAQFMEPLRSAAGIDAARSAARKRGTGVDGDDGTSRSAGGADGGVPRWLRPCTDCLSDAAGRCRGRWRRFVRKSRARTGACLDGNRPYGFSIRLTGVNYFVLCSIWYLYIDQLRLAFIPPSADFACAVVSAFVWASLFLELMMEMFIRPTGYRVLTRSDKAYLPSTVRYLSNFHLISELISLVLFIPEFMCLFTTEKCGDKLKLSLASFCLKSLYGPTRLDAFLGTAYLCMMRLRIFGLVRHWTKMWINNTFVRVRGPNGEWRVQRGKGLFFPQGHRGGRVSGDRVISMSEPTGRRKSATRMRRLDGSSTASLGGQSSSNEEKKNEYTDDYHLTNASKIGTALFTTNAQRVLIFAFLIGLYPLISVAVMPYGGTNQQPWNSVDVLQANNIVLNNTDNETCAQLNTTLVGWLKSNAIEHTVDGTDMLHILSLEVEPKRCGFQRRPGSNSILWPLLCRNHTMGADVMIDWLCHGLPEEGMRHKVLEEHHDIRPSLTIRYQNKEEGTDSSVSVLYNETLSVRRLIISLFSLQLGTTLCVLLFLSVLRNDAGRLVLGPLRRMLKIVAFYAKNPLTPPGSMSLTERSYSHKQNDVYYDSDDETTDRQLGTFETEQLINAVTKITDLLRKCWGVAGAGIISSNLARQEGGLTTYFNPTVPGKAVYALFAFAAIDKFQNHLHALKEDIMILINDIAAVLHEEVYRWAYHERGECNKNLGSAFLMVYKIGDVTDVLEKREMAEAVIFARKETSKVRKRKSRKTSSRPPSLQRSMIGASRTGSVVDAEKYSRSHVDNIDLSSLPGMRTFTDRALLGLLKTFASIHRDKTIINWNNDFRLGAGVGAASIDLNFGMDAGWAVEGAVGSLYKIDATYLSPHVNMASRMMSATKQYGVFFLLSQAVESLLSENAQDKLRHLDTVTVKGSSVQQKIYTYDAKVRPDFFLYSRSVSQADEDADRYTPAIWNTDQDLVAMRNHVSREFMDVFNQGRDEYLAGNWPEAIRLLKSADMLMFETEVEEGYCNLSYSDNLRSLTNLSDRHEKEERMSMGDGACQRLIAYMEERGGEAPSDWRGFRPLTSK